MRRDADGNFANRFNDALALNSSSERRHLWRSSAFPKAWFKIDFVPKMSRVLLTIPEFGRPYGRSSRRAMSDGALTRAQRELIATMVSAINVCQY